MVKNQLIAIKKWIVSKSGEWFYSSKKLPIGTHLGLFFKHRVDIDMNVVFDIGANQGQFSKYIQVYLPYSKFFCFEPFPQTFLELKKNLEDSRFTHFQLAFGDFQESLSVLQNNPDSSDTNSLIHRNNRSRNKDEVNIEVITLDHFLEENQIEAIDLLKIDTEGYDLKVLKGAKESLKAGRIKLVYVECGLDPSNDYHVFFPEILSFLNNLNYVFLGLFQTDIRKIDRKIHFSNALFVHESFSTSIKTFG